MAYTFSGASVFNSDLSKWAVSRVTDMAYTFAHALVFNSDVSKWSVSRVTTMQMTFTQASAFNGDLSKWAVSGVSDMYNMLSSAIAFDQVLCANEWVSNTANRENMFQGTNGASIAGKIKFYIFFFHELFFF